MDITQTTLWEDIQTAIDAGEKPVHHRWRCQLQAMGTSVEVDQVVSLSVTRQYRSNFNDETIATLKLESNTYHDLIFPFRDELLVILYKEPIGEVSTEDDYEKEPDVRIYRGILINTESDTVSSTQDKGVSSNGSMQDVHVQLIERAAEQIRMKSVSGIYRNLSTGLVVQGVLTAIAGELGLDEREAPLGVDMVPGDNETTRDHVVVPQGTLVTQFPRYVQNECGGIYRHGLGYYLQNRIWYVYPELHLHRFDSEQRNLTVVNVPPNRLPGIERTYYTDEERVVVIATGKTKQFDASESRQLTLGNGARFGNAARVIHDFRRVENNETYVAASNNMSEVVAAGRRVGLNYAPMSARRITANPYREMSELAERQGEYIQIEWQNANPDLIYPGMPVRYVYSSGDELRYLYGQVAGCDHETMLKGKGRTATRYQCSAIVTLFVERIENV